MATVWQADPLWTQQLGGFTGIRGGGPAHLTLGSQLLESNQASRCSTVRNPALPRPGKCVGGEGVPSDGRRQEQERLWQQFFVDPTMWWDNRRDKKSSRSPDFRRKGSGEVLWLNSMCKPDWVDEQLDALDMQMGSGASPSKHKPESGVTVGTLCHHGKLTEAVGLESMLQIDRPISHPTLGSQLLASDQGFSPRSVQNRALPLPKCLGGLEFSSDRRRQEQEALWQDLFLDPTVWWDNRRENSQLPDFRRKGSGEVLWLNSMFKPDWVDEQLGSLDMRMARGSFPSKFKAEEPRKRAGSGMGVVTAVAVSTFCEQGKSTEAVGALESLAQTDYPVPKSLLCAVLKLCTVDKDVVLGQRVHDLAVELGYESDTYLGNHVLRMYASGGMLHEAMDVFTRVGKSDAFMWFSIISAHAKHGKPKEAIRLYHEMRGSDAKADAHVFVAALQACALASDLESGRKVHADVLRSGIPLDLFVGACLVDMYAKCGELSKARYVFDNLTTKNVVTWNALIAGYVNHGLCQEALVLHEQMEQDSLIEPDHVTFVSLLKACASGCALLKGRQLHSQIVERGQLDNLVLGTCLVDMYAKCGELDEARQVFDSSTTKDVVAWTALIAGYAQQGLGHEALLLYGQMEQEGLLVADHVTFACLLKACASVGALQTGRQLHSQIVESGQLHNVVVGTCLVDMYAKCGELEAARGVFNSLPMKNVMTWTALIAGCGTSDDVHKASDYFEEMLAAGIQPDDAIYTCILAACSRMGLVDEGRAHFNSMVEQHGIKPTLEHYTCMIDLLGRAGRLDEAEKMLLSCESQSNVVGLTSLLNACKSHGDVERARKCFESLVTLEPQNASAYVLMANAYADAGRWTDVDRIETQRMLAGAKKKPAVASIEVKRQVHTFVVGEKKDDLVPKVEITNARLKQEGGHVPHTKLVLKPLSEKEKEDSLCGHAEKLALAFGLLNTPDGTPLLVTKNLRMCSDCHSSTEIMSRIEKRDIVVRDGYRVHRFVDGCCSCEGRP